MTLEELATSLGFPSFPLLFAIAIALALVLGLIIFIPILLKVIEIASYAYSNSRIRVMESRIISEDKLREMIEASSLAEIVTALDGYLVKVGKDISITQPFGIGPAIGYLSMKDMEIRNVRTLARGIEVGLSPDEIRNLIMKVGT